MVPHHHLNTSTSKEDQPNPDIQCEDSFDLLSSDSGNYQSADEAFKWIHSNDNGEDEPREDSHRYSVKFGSNDKTDMVNLIYDRIEDRKRNSDDDDESGSDWENLGDDGNKRSLLGGNSKSSGYAYNKKHERVTSIKPLKKDSMNDHLKVKLVLRDDDEESTFSIMVSAEYSPTIKTSLINCQ